MLIRALGIIWVFLWRYVNKIIKALTVFFFSFPSGHRYLSGVLQESGSLDCRISSRFQFYPGTFALATASSTGYWHQWRQRICQLSPSQRTDWGCKEYAISSYTKQAPCAAADLGSRQGLCWGRLLSAYIYTHMYMNSSVWWGSTHFSVLGRSVCVSCSPVAVTSTKNSLLSGCLY